MGWAVALGLVVGWMLARAYVAGLAADSRARGRVLLRKGDRFRLGQRLYVAQGRDLGPDGAVILEATRVQEMPWTSSQ